MHKLQVFRNSEFVGTIDVMRLPTGREALLYKSTPSHVGPYEEIRHSITKLPVKHRHVRITRFDLMRYGEREMAEKHAIPNYATREVEMLDDALRFRWPVGFIDNDDDLMDEVFDFDDFEPADTEPYPVDRFDSRGSEPVTVPIKLREGAETAIRWAIEELGGDWNDFIRA